MVQVVTPIRNCTFKWLRAACWSEIAWSWKLKWPRDLMGKNRLILYIAMQGIYMAHNFLSLPFSSVSPEFNFVLIHYGSKALNCSNGNDFLMIFTEYRMVKKKQISIISPQSQSFTIENDILKLYQSDLKQNRATGGLMRWTILDYTFKTVFCRFELYILCLKGFVMGTSKNETTKSITVGIVATK